MDDSKYQMGEIEAAMRDKLTAYFKELEVF